MFSLLIFLSAWSGRAASVRAIEKKQGILMATEGFRTIHKDSEVPLNPTHLTWTEMDEGKYVVEADGTRVLSTGKVPKRWSVTLHHEGDSWQIVDTNWK